MITKLDSRNRLQPRIPVLVLPSLLAPTIINSIATQWQGWACKNIPQIMSLQRLIMSLREKVRAFQGHTQSATMLPFWLHLLPSMSFFSTHAGLPDVLLTLQGLTSGHLHLWLFLPVLCFCFCVGSLVSGMVLSSGGTLKRWALVGES